MDPEYETSGERQDERDLTEEWLENYKNSYFVWNQQQFDVIDPKTTDHLLGLFEPSHMQYNHDRSVDEAGEPSLGEMTAKAIDILNKNDKGFSSKWRQEESIMPIMIPIPIALFPILLNSPMPSASH